jgi:hypothetical protein
MSCCCALISLEGAACKAIPHFASGMLALESSGLSNIISRLRSDCVYCTIKLNRNCPYLTKLILQ